MKFSLLLAAGLPLTSVAGAEEKSGHASAELLCGVSSYQPGETVPVAIRLKIEPGWHSYWINPGIGGMPLKATWTLPDGWKAGELQQPVPKRFMTGDLPGFGYEGEAVFLVDLTPSGDAAGEASLQVKLAWLTCNENSCVPGNVELSLKLPAGDGAANGNAPVIETAAAKIPKSVEHTRAGVTEEDGVVTMRFHMPGDYDFKGSQVFPATPDVMDPAAPITVKWEGERWSVSALKSEYADGAAEALDLVFAGGNLKHPVVVCWRGK